MLSEMTLAEKVGQMTQLSCNAYNSTGELDAVDIVEEKLRPLIRDWHVGSFLNGYAIPAAQWVAYGRRLQEINLEESRLKIPMIYGVDHVHGTNYVAGGTVFPQPLNLAATFDDSLAAAMGTVTAREAADLGHHWIFAPILDVGLNPYWSRLYETFGEEPLLAQRMGSAFIRALQEKVPERRALAACAKHFLGYSDPRSGWDRTPAHIPDQYLQEFYVPPFRAAVEAGVLTLMINSGEVNGVPVHASRRLLTGLLREQLGFEGVAVTDWEDIVRLVREHRVAATEKEATRMALEAGIDMAMTPFTTDFCRYTLELVEEGVIEEARIDRSVARILRLKEQLGLFEDPFPRADRLAAIGCAEHRALAARAAEASVVVLRNEGILPLEGRVALVGPCADSRRDLCGGWTLRWTGAAEEEYPAWMKTLRQALEATPRMAEGDVIVVAVGEEPYAEGFGNIEDLALPLPQQRLLDRVAASGKPFCIVVVGGRPRLITPWASQAAAVVWAGLPGYAGAEAVAGVLTGRVNPSGRLPFSYPSTGGHLVPYHHKPADRSTALWGFGHGLSYTTFEYTDLVLEGRRALVTVTNTGETTGVEVVLWFLTDEVGRITRPVSRLRHYERLVLRPGESCSVGYEIADQDLGYPDEQGEMVFEPGTHVLSVGGLSVSFSFPGADPGTP